MERIKENKGSPEWITVTQSICCYEYTTIADFIAELTHIIDSGPLFIRRGCEVRLQWRQVFDYSHESPEDHSEAKL